MHRLIPAATAAVAILTSVPLVAAAAGSTAKAIPAADLQWKDAGVPGVSTAVVDGHMGKGASHFYLKYAAGFVAPVHHHSADHHVALVSGNLVLVVDGKDQRLTPGSYFVFKGKAKHGARCEGSQDCVMFIDARAPWDVVVAKDPR
jgi:quercetin dioxygenase-like cupin family protein